MRKIPVTAAGSIDRELFDRVARQLQAQRTLGDVLSWGRMQAPPRSVTEIVTQDEYTHDVVVELEALTIPEVVEAPLLTARRARTLGSTVQLRSRRHAHTGTAQ